MSSTDPNTLSRRSFVFGSVGSVALIARSPLSAANAPSPSETILSAATNRLPLVGPPHPETDVWCYDGRIPGPELRVRQGERIRVRLENHLPEETTIHWHGVRLPNAMDGVPHLTQKPVLSGEGFTYEFTCPDAGTFWYHPHQRSHVQVERGLYGALIVEEPTPPSVDRDLTWVLDDWRLLRDGSISDDFGNMHDVSHNGRIGNTVTINGRIRETFNVRAGERIRLRLVNTANARIFGLEFADHRPVVIALDGQPVEPHVPDAGRIVIGPGMRTDLIIDMEGQPTQRSQIADTFYRSLEYRLVDLVYSDEQPIRSAPLDTSIRLAPNPIPEPNLKEAQRHTIVLGGGMMGMMRSAIMDGKRVDMRTLMHNGLAWTINGVAARGHIHEPLLSLDRNRTYLIDLVNDTAWPHPMHLHGHSFRVISRNGKPTRHNEWSDTVLLQRRDRAEIAFVADNPGDWMFHCHILEHQVGGMMGTIRVN